MTVLQLLSQVCVHVELAIIKIRKRKDYLPSLTLEGIYIIKCSSKKQFAPIYNLTWTIKFLYGPKWNRFVTL